MTKKSHVAQPLTAQHHDELLAAGVPKHVIVDAARANLDWGQILGFLVNGGLAGLIKAVKDALDAAGVTTPKPAV